MLKSIIRPRIEILIWHTYGLFNFEFPELRFFATLDERNLLRLTLCVEC